MTASTTGVRRLVTSAAAACARGQTAGMRAMADAIPLHLFRGAGDRAVAAAFQTRSRAARSTPARARSVALRRCRSVYATRLPDNLTWVIHERRSAARKGDGPMVMIQSDKLVEVAERILAAAGATPANARTVATSLVEANLVGHDSHGVRRLGPYLESIRAGRLDPAAEPAVESARTAASTVDGRRGFGQAAARLAVTEAQRLASAHGVGVVAIRRCNHVGRLGEYVEMLAHGDAVGLAFGNADATVAPYGGRERRLGTNPLAWAAPRAAGRAPVVADFATAAIAEGKVALAAAADEQIPPGAVVGPDGRPTTEPADLYRGGALLPFGQHKGYALSVLIEIVGGLLTGTGVSSLPGYDGTFGTVLVAVDIAAFAPVDEFRGQCEDFCALLAGTAPAEGGQVRVPGEIEAASRAERLRDGIPLSDRTWADLAALPGGPAPA
jgi:uncharacterized oxidoreductase